LKSIRFWFLIVFFWSNWHSLSRYILVDFLFVCANTIEIYRFGYITLYNKCDFLIFWKTVFSKRNRCFRLITTHFVTLTSLQFKERSHLLTRLYYLDLTSNGLRFWSWTINFERKYLSKQSRHRCFFVLNKTSSSFLFFVVDNLRYQRFREYSDSFGFQSANRSWKHSDTRIRRDISLNNNENIFL